MKKILQAESKAIQDKINLKINCPNDRLDYCPSCMAYLDDIEYGVIDDTAGLEEWGESSNTCRCKKCNAYWCEVWVYKGIEFLEIRDEDTYA